MDRSNRPDPDRADRDRAAFIANLRHLDDRMRALAYGIVRGCSGHGRRDAGGLPEGLSGPSHLPGRVRLLDLAGHDRLSIVHRRTPSTPAKLPPEQRAVVLLVDAQGYSHAETAQVLGIAPGTVASRASRARASLRQILTTKDDLR